MNWTCPVAIESRAILSLTLSGGRYVSTQFNMFVHMEAKRGIGAVGNAEMVAKNFQFEFKRRGAESRGIGGERGGGGGWGGGMGGGGPFVGKLCCWWQVVCCFCCFCFCGFCVFLVGGCCWQAFAFVVCAVLIIFRRGLQKAMFVATIPRVVRKLKGEQLGRNNQFLDLLLGTILFTFPASPK